MNINLHVNKKKSRFHVSCTRVERARQKREGEVYGKRHAGLFTRLIMETKEKKKKKKNEKKKKTILKKKKC